MWGKEKAMAHQFNTLIAEGAEIVGDINIRGGLHIDGRIRGNICAEAGADAVIRISDKGSVEGEIRAPHIIINGRVNGDVYSSEHLELAPKGSVSGNVHYNMIEMVMGAEVNGSLLHHIDGMPQPGTTGLNVTPTPLRVKNAGGSAPASNAVPHDTDSGFGKKSGSK